MNKDEFNMKQIKDSKINEAIKIIDNLTNELYELDLLLYDGIMGVYYAQGFLELYKIDNFLDLSKVEGMVRNVRLDNEQILNSLNNK